MPRYSEERTAAVLRKMLPPNNQSVPQVAKEEGIMAVSISISNQTLERGLP
ncbi:MAG: hypothetical protein KAG53_03655 [Endozoicomonadaceae bacterium]|nr:hypothetical protein [Endozoicomonadaceae bacterium]